jgi:hypothetical protein
MYVPTCLITDRPLAHCQCSRCNRRRRIREEGEVGAGAPTPLYPVEVCKEHGEYYAGNWFCPKCTLTLIVNRATGFALEDSEDGAHCTPLKDSKPRCHGTTGLGERSKPLFSFTDDPACTPPDPSPFTLVAGEPSCECNKYPGRGHAPHCGHNVNLNVRECLECSDGSRCVPDVEEARESADRPGQPQAGADGSNAVPGTTVLRSTLEALEYLLGTVNELNERDVFTPNRRRAIRDMVQGPLDNWLRCRDSKAGPNSRYLDALSNPFWMALNEWVERGASAREQLHSSVRQLLAALDDTDRRGSRL